MLQKRNDGKTVKNILMNYFGFGIKVMVVKSTTDTSFMRRLNNSTFNISFVDNMPLQ